MTNAVATQEDLYAGLSPEDVATMLAMSGQAANAGFEKAPLLKVNYSAKKDKDGNQVDLGNFVLNQSIKTVDGKKVVEYIGKDLGPSPEVTVIKVAKQYSYYNDKKELRCASQLITEPGEVPIGNTLKHDCMGGKCPRRAKEIDKKEKCSCQFVVYLEAGPDKDKCIMYFKGVSFMPFKEYIDSVGQDPIFFYPTTFRTKEQSMGTVDYYIVYPEIDKTRPYPLEVRKENMEKLKAVSKDIQGFKMQQAATSKQITYVDAEVTDSKTTEGYEDISF